MMQPGRTIAQHSSVVRWRPVVGGSSILLLLALALVVSFHSERTRADATVVPLPNGDLLRIGGDGGCRAIGGFTGLCHGRPLATTERYSPATRRWIPAGRLSTPRSSFTATPLRDGRVLAVGGDTQRDVESFPVTLATAERYDPATNRWTAAAPMHIARSFHTATLLADGRVLVSGGQSPRSHLLADAEVYDPVADRWQDTGPMHDGRWRHTATLLASDQVLVAGGDTTRDYHAATAEIYDPATNAWHPAHDMGVGRSEHTAALLANGRVLVTGGDGQEGRLTDAEAYDPAADRWQPARMGGLTAALRAGNARYRAIEEML